MITLHKYPRTLHIEGSRLQPGDAEGDNIPFAALAGRNLVVEEKLDGANAAISFDSAGQLWLQSRGHFLTGGAREKHFHRFKQWAHGQAHLLREALADRYVLYGEWLYAKHTIFYDQLPHYFLEFDVLDTQTREFRSTEARRTLLSGLPIQSVPVVWVGQARSVKELLELIGPSIYKSPGWREQLAALCDDRRLDRERIWKETDHADLMEGLYIKVEEQHSVVGRYKYVRADFLNSVVDSGSHWLQRPIIPNQLREGVELFGGET